MRPVPRDVRVIDVRAADSTGRPHGRHRAGRRRHHRRHHRRGQYQAGRLAAATAAAASVGRAVAATASIGQTAGRADATAASVRLAAAAAAAATTTSIGRAAAAAATTTAAASIPPDRHGSTNCVTRVSCRDSFAPHSALGRDSLPRRSRVAFQWRWQSSLFCGKRARSATATSTREKLRAARERRVSIVVPGWAFFRFSVLVIPTGWLPYVTYSTRG